jgi:hypothetical protein
MPPTLEEFKEACRRECSFLVSEYDFQEMPEPREYNDFSVCFRRGALGVDVFGEGWGQHASCDLVHGKEELGIGSLVPKGAWPQHSRRHPPDQLEQIATIGAMLRAHCTDFLTGDLTRFSAAVARWKEITKPRPISDAQREQRAFDTACSEAGHAFKRGDFNRVIELLTPHMSRLGRRHAAMLEAARKQT